MSLKKAKKDNSKIIKGIDKTSDNIQKKSKTLYNKAIDEVIRQNNKNKPFTANSLVSKKIDNDLRNILNNVDSSYDDFINASKKYLANNFEIDLTKAELNTLIKKKSDLIDELLTNTSILKEDIKAILFANLGKGVSQNELTRLLKNLYPAYARNAGTIINTGLGRVYIDANVSKFKQLDFNWFLYAGPDDKVTRDIPCKHWVNHKFSASQIDIVYATRLSLWNCRHSIIPLDDEEAKNYSELNISLSKQ
jgi:hypothetical protein